MMENSNLRFFLVLLTLLALAATPLGSAPASAAPNTATSWAISGTVYGSSTPPPDAYITLNDAST